MSVYPPPVPLPVGACGVASRVGEKSDRAGNPATRQPCSPSGCIKTVQYFRLCSSNRARMYKSLQPVENPLQTVDNRPENVAKV